MRWLIPVLTLSLTVGDRVDATGCVPPVAVIFTTYEKSYDVRDLVPQAERLTDIDAAARESNRDPMPRLSQLRRDFGGVAGAERLAGFLAIERGIWPGERIEILNGTRLAVTTTAWRHAQIADSLHLLRVLADLSVIMNARLFAVERTFYDKEIAPLFAPSEPGKPTRLATRIGGTLFREISRQDPVQQSEPDQLLPDREALFFSRQRVAHSRLGAEVYSAVVGATFRVTPEVSLDRRHLRLTITRTLADFEGARVSEHKLTDTIHIPDRDPILMPVGCQPPGKDGEDRVWVLVARPYLLIQSEAKLHQEAGEEFSPRSVWDQEVHEVLIRKETTRLPASEKVTQILRAIVTDVLTADNLKGTRGFYGTAEDKAFVLRDAGRFGWPKGFKPDTHGYQMVDGRSDPFVPQRRLLGIDIRQFDLNRKAVKLLFDGPIEVCVFNAGGSANGGVIGGCSVYYRPKFVNGRWTVEQLGWRDP